MSPEQATEMLATLNNLGVVLAQVVIMLHVIAGLSAASLMVQLVKGRVGS